jgi:NAD-dependent deacetylase
LFFNVIYYIVLKPASINDLPNKLKVLPLPAVEGMKILKKELLNLK